MDRDGTLNRDKGYVYRIEDWEWIPGAIDAIVSLKKAGFLVVVITNQAGIARGYYTETDMIDLHNTINQELKLRGTGIDRFYHCPHHPEFGLTRECACRKPMPGMIYKARQDLNIDLDHSWLIGDKTSDIEAGLAAGVRSILVMTGYGVQSRDLLGKNDIYVADVMEASCYIISHS